MMITSSYSGQRYEAVLVGSHYACASWELYVSYLAVAVWDVIIQM